MSELTLLLLQVGFLILLWFFVFAVVYSLRADLFGVKVRKLPEPAAAAPVAALFAIMTKVGLYAIIRVHGTVFGEAAGALAFIHSDWVLAAGLITSLMAALGVMASRVLRKSTRPTP